MTEKTADWRGRFLTLLTVTVITVGWSAVDKLVLQPRGMEAQRRRFETEYSEERDEIRKQLRSELETYKIARNKEQSQQILELTEASGKLKSENRTLSRRVSNAEQAANESRIEAKNFRTKHAAAAKELAYTREKLVKLERKVVELEAAGNTMLDKYLQVGEGHKADLQGIVGRLLRLKKELPKKTSPEVTDRLDTVISRIQTMIKGKE